MDSVSSHWNSFFVGARVQVNCEFLRSADMGEEGDVVQVGSGTGNATELITVDFNDGRKVRIPFIHLDVVSDDSDEIDERIGLRLLGRNVTESPAENAAPAAEGSENPTRGKW